MSTTERGPRAHAPQAMTSALSLDEVIGGVMAALHPLAAERCDTTALLTILKQHDIFSYEDLGDVLIGKAAEPLRAALRDSAPLIFLSKLVELYYNDYRGVPRDLPHEEQAKADDQWWKAHNNTVTVFAAAQRQQLIEQPRILRSAVKAGGSLCKSPATRAGKALGPPSTVVAKRQRIHEHGSVRSGERAGD